LVSSASATKTLSPSPRAAAKYLAPRLSGTAEGAARAEFIERSKSDKELNPGRFAERGTKAHRFRVST